MSELINMDICDKFSHAKQMTKDDNAAALLVLADTIQGKKFFDPDRNDFDLLGHELCLSMALGIRRALFGNDADERRSIADTMYGVAEEQIAPALFSIANALKKGK